ncbi:MAG: hypothetical protein JSW38_06960 [Dehalococcoidia bacterium]|nr:MAG: hypothetical protein JSW38_06960 [Dehalococcoidia bacterium]
MNGNGVLIYREEQKFAAWLCWLVYISMGLAVWISVFALKKEFSGQSEPGTLEILLAVIVGIGVPIAIAALFVFLKLETEVRSDGIYIRYLPFHIRFKRFAPEDLSEYYARQYKPIREYGGWGIRCGLFGKGKAYNVSGNKGVQLVFKNGKRLLIGSQKAEELETAIRSIKGGG